MWFPRKSFIVWFTESVDRQISDMCGWARVTRILCAKHKKVSWLFSVGDFVLGSLFCAQRLWILNLFSADTEIWASRFEWLRNQHEFPSRRHFNPTTYFVRSTTRLAISNLSVSSPGSVFHPSSPKWDKIPEDIGRSRLCQTWELFFHKA